MGTAFHIGTSGFAYKEWKGSFYPDDLPAKRMLEYYAARFGAVEMNNSFYKLPTREAVAGWAAEVPKSFRFTMKAPQRITHFKRLKDVGGPVAEFAEVAGGLGPRLGALLFGLPPNFKKDVGRLRGLLEAVPRRRRVAVEFRHPSWFDEEVYRVLRKRNAAMCVAEAEKGEEGDVEVPFVATADWGYVRLRKKAYTGPRLKAWIKRMEGAGWRDVFVFFKHEETGTGPRFGAKMRGLVEGGERS